MGGYRSTQVAFICYERVTDKNECVSRKAIVGLTTHHKYNYWLTILCDETQVFKHTEPIDLTRHSVPGVDIFKVHF